MVSSRTFPAIALAAIPVRRPNRLSGHPPKAGHVTTRSCCGVWAVIRMCSIPPIIHARYGGRPGVMTAFISSSSGPHARSARPCVVTRRIRQVHPGPCSAPGCLNGTRVRRCGAAQGERSVRPSASHEGTFGGPDLIGSNCGLIRCRIRPYMNQGGDARRRALPWEGRPAQACRQLTLTRVNISPRFVALRTAVFPALDHPVRGRHVNAACRRRSL